MRYDVLIVGAGPAGSIAARRLAAAGARVALVGGAQRPGMEGLSARSAALLAVEDPDLPARLGEPLERRGRWADRDVTGREWLIDRRELAAALTASAARAGAWVMRDRIVGLARAGAGWRATLKDGAALEATHLIDARGRRGAERRGPLLLALGRAFRLHAADGVSSPAGTGIAVTDSLWCWWAVREGSLWVQVVGRPHPRACAEPRPAQWLAAAAHALPELAALLESSVPEGPAVACPAHARLGRRGIGEQNRWRAGDAALAPDPLSGQGVYEAVRGAHLVATAVRAVLEGCDCELAQRFIAARQEQAFHDGVRIAADFYAENAARGRFWADTAAGYRQLLPVRAAVEPCIARRPVLANGRIEERDVLITPGHPRGVWHVEGVPLVALQEYLQGTPHATLAAAARVFARPPQAVAAAVRWLQGSGLAAPRRHGSI